MALTLPGVTVSFHRVSKIKMYNNIMAIFMQLTDTTIICDSDKKWIHIDDTSMEHVSSKYIDDNYVKVHYSLY